MTERTADAGTPPPNWPPESIHPSVLAPEGFFAYEATLDRRSTVSVGKGPTTEPPFDGHGVVASATGTGVTDADVVDVGVEGTCAARAGLAEGSGN
jgi:hypothetical protein